MRAMAKTLGVQKDRLSAHFEAWDIYFQRPCAPFLGNNNFDHDSYPIAMDYHRSYTKQLSSSIESFTEHQ
ncbi:unnamed protein product [Acanthoscelides obtectus]|uniref:Uncharacterized protein n=1 Tax=Acanthoscelides obtectus TaxID=200917 RepID=A0A9P0KPB3_ACAOB|nr:unnamed protein product [Acanthoscelides obtectus]CAK1657201.1 hypothetical protein AOBTE_LOCUS20200 [Acanthoscelides obtectus]